MDAKIYYEKDASLDYIIGKTVAILRYARFGEAFAKNMRDSGINVVIGEESANGRYQQAIADGFDTMSYSEAVKYADMVCFLTSYEQQAHIYKTYVEKHLNEGTCILFAHGYVIRYHQIIPPPYVDIIMVAPGAPASTTRSTFLAGTGVTALVAVEQDYTGIALNLALAVAKANGCTKAGVIETTFKEETETDLFGEQVVFCGAIPEIIRAAFNLLVKSGYSPEVAYLKCLWEVKLITDLMHDGGIEWMRKSVSETAAYGGLVAGKYLVDEVIEEKMKKILSDIQTGRFVHEWNREHLLGKPIFNSLLIEEQSDLLAATGEKLRTMMPWVTKKSF